MPHRVATRIVAMGRRRPRAKYFYSVIFLQSKVLIVFCPNFGQISSKFFYSKLSNDFFFENIKVTETFSKMFKVYAFYSFFLPQIVKSNFLKAIK
jgi:hypothetical protein